jgi:tissue inhibitor of metalloproteinase
MRRRLGRALAVVVLALSGIAATASPCWACSCAGATPKEHAKSADVVFTGRVKEIRGGDSDDGTLGDDNLKVRFRVQKVYKGKARRTTTVRTNESGAACGYGFVEGKRYTVFAQKANGKLSTNLCSGTKRGGIDPDKYGLPEGYPPED